MKKLNGKKLIMSKADYLFGTWQQTGDVGYLIEFAKMIENDEIKYAPKHDGQLYFNANSSYKDNCNKCGEVYDKGDPIFHLNGSGWHAECGSEQDKLNHFYQKWFAGCDQIKIDTADPKMQIRQTAMSKNNLIGNDPFGESE